VKNDLFRSEMKVTFLKVKILYENPDDAADELHSALRQSVQKALGLDLDIPGYHYENPVYICCLPGEYDYIESGPTWFFKPTYRSYQAPLVSVQTGEVDPSTFCSDYMVAADGLSLQMTPEKVIDKKFLEAPEDGEWIYILTEFGHDHCKPTVPNIKMTTNRQQAYDWFVKELRSITGADDDTKFVTKYNIHVDDCCIVQTSGDGYGTDTPIGVTVRKVKLSDLMGGHIAESYSFLEKF
jgi:hypothetical protein